MGARCRDVKIIFVDASTDPVRVYKAGEDATSRVGDPEIAVARGRPSGLGPHGVARRASAGGWSRSPPASGQALVLAQSLEPTDRMLDRLGLVMLLFGVAGMIIAGLAGWAVARNGLRPVRRLTASVEDIARTQRLDPIPIEGSDEVARLAQSFNEMLRTLSASQHRQRQLVADAGHELRTPLTSLRTNLDLLVQADATTGPAAGEPRRAARRRARPDRRDDHADRRPGRARPRRAGARRPSSRSSSPPSSSRRGPRAPARRRRVRRTAPRRGG